MMTRTHKLTSGILPAQTGFYPVILTGVWSLVQGWEQQVKAPEAPANYKDPAKIEEYVAKKRQTLYLDVLENCPSLWDVHDVTLYAPLELSIEMPDGLNMTEALDYLFGPEALPGFDRIVVIGENADKLLRAVYLRELPEEDELYADDHQRVATLVAGKRIPTMTPESLLFTAEERKFLRSTSPGKEPGQTEFEYIHSLLCRYFGKRFAGTEEFKYERRKDFR